MSNIVITAAREGIFAPAPSAKYAISGLPLYVGKWDRGNKGKGNGRKRDTRGNGAFVLERDIST